MDEYDDRDDLPIIMDPRMWKGEPKETKRGEKETKRRRKERDGASPSRSPILAMKEKDVGGEEAEWMRETLEAFENAMEMFAPLSESIVYQNSEDEFTSYLLRHTLDERGVDVDQLYEYDQMNPSFVADVISDCIRTVLLIQECLHCVTVSHGESVYLLVHDADPDPVKRMHVLRLKYSRGALRLRIDHQHPQIGTASFTRFRCRIVLNLLGVKYKITENPIKDFQWILNLASKEHGAGVGVGGGGAGVVGGGGGRAERITASGERRSNGVHPNETPTRSTGRGKGFRMDMGELHKVRDTFNLIGDKMERVFI